MNCGVTEEEKPVSKECKETEEPLSFELQHGKRRVERDDVRKKRCLVELRAPGMRSEE